MIKLISIICLRIVFFFLVISELICWLKPAYFFWVHLTNINARIIHTSQESNLVLVYSLRVDQYIVFLKVRIQFCFSIFFVYVHLMNINARIIHTSEEPIKMSLMSIQLSKKSPWLTNKSFFFSFFLIICYAYC